jgi:flagellar motor switch protein FliM
MSNQILTQEEIDALLSAMERGDVDLEQEPKKNVEAAPYNLTSQNVMLRDQFSALDEVYDKFARLLRDSLSSSLQRAVAIDFVSTEMVKYQEFISAFSNPTNFSLWCMEPLIGNALLAIEPNLVFSLIDCMFGGDGRPTANVREFTEIEQRMIKKVAEEILSKFEKAWSSIYTVTIQLKKIESKPEFVQLVPPSDSMMVVVFSIKRPEFTGNFHLAIPYLMIEPIKDQLSPKYLREKDTAHPWRSRLTELIKNTHITVIAELGRTKQTVRDLLNLQVDDILKLNGGPEDLISICIDQIPKYEGYPGIIKGNRAVEIEKLLKQNGGKN